MSSSSSRRWRTPSCLTWAEPSPSSLHRRTAGNPFFVRETLRQLEETGAISVADGTWVSHERLDELGIAEGVKIVVGQRLASVSPSTHDAASRRCRDRCGSSISTCSAACSAGTSQRSSPRWKTPSRRVSSTNMPIGWIASHSCMRWSTRCLLGELSHSRRARLEWATAEAIVALHEHDLDEWIADLAVHAAAGAAVGDPARAFDWCMRAAVSRPWTGSPTRRRSGPTRWRCGSCPYGEAAPIASERTYSSSSVAPPTERATLTGGGRRVSRRRRSPGEIGDAACLGRAAISYLGSLAQGPIDPTVVQLLDEAIEAVRVEDPTPPGQALLAELLARLSGYLTNMDGERSTALAGEAVMVARQVGDSRSLALALMYSTQSYTLPREEHLARLHEAARLAEEAGDVEILLQANSNLMAAALIWTDRDEFDRRLAEYARVAETTGAPTFLVLRDIDHAGAAALDGRYGEAFDRARDALRRIRTARRSQPAEEHRRRPGAGEPRARADPAQGLPT